MVRVPAAAVHVKVRTGIDSELTRVGHGAATAAVYEHRRVAAVLLHNTLAVGVIPVVRHIAVLAYRHQAVLLIPAELLLAGAVAVRPVIALPRSAGIGDVAV